MVCAGATPLQAESKSDVVCVALDSQREETAEDWLRSGGRHAGRDGWERGIPARRDNGRGGRERLGMRTIGGAW